MRNFKKLLAILLSIAMVMCSTLPNFASANDASSESTEFVEETHDEQESIEETSEDELGETAEEETEESSRGELGEPAEEETEESESDYAEEPEEDETTAVVEEPEEDETTVAVEEPEEDETTAAVEESEEDETTAVAEEETSDNNVGASSASPEETSESSETTESSETVNPASPSELIEISAEANDKLLGATPTPWMYWYLTDEDGDTILETIRFSSTNPSSTYNSIDAESGYPINYGTLDKSSITMAIFDDDINAVTCRGLFDGFENLLAIQDFENLKTGAVTQMYEMFKGCRQLDNIDLSGLNTESVTDMGAMFYECQELKSIDLSGLNTENVETIQEMFFGCSSLKAINLSGFKTPNIIITSGMFRGCSSLKILDLRSFDTENVTTMTSMFRDCTSLTTIIATDKFKTSSVVLDLGANMFTGCSNLVGCQGTGIDATTDERRARIDEAGNPGYFSSAPWMYWYLIDSDGDSTYETIKYTNTEATSGDYGFVTRRDQVVYNDLTKSDITKAVFDNSITPVTCERFFEGFTNLTKIDGLEKLTTNNVKSMKKMFYGCNKLKYLDLGSFDTSNVELMGEMFKDCSSLITIIASNKFSTISVSDNGADMFSLCGRLFGCYGTEARTHSALNKDLARIDEGTLARGFFSSSPWMYWYLTDSNQTIHYTNTKPTSGDYEIMTRRDGIVYNGLGITDIGAITKAEFDNNVTAVTCRAFFNEFSSMVDIVNLNKLDTQNVNSMMSMFVNCSQLDSLDLSNFNTSNVTSMGYMFYNCSSLTSLDLNKFDTSNVENTQYMFYGCSSLTKIIVSNSFVTTSVTMHNNMFAGCTNLVGGAGTTYNSGHTDKEYARIDGGPSSTTPGYFTSNVAPNPTPTPNYPSGGGSGGSSGSSGSGGGGGGGGGGPVTEDVPAVTYLPYVKSIIGFANNLMSKWSQDAMSSKWKLSVTAENGSEMNLKNGFVLYTHISTQIVGNTSVQTAANNTYVFDENGNMITGWVHTADGKTYFFENKKTSDEGRMIIGWKQIQGSWYYFGADGAMYANTVTPDGHPVGPDGKWQG